MRLAFLKHHKQFFILFKLLSVKVTLKKVKTLHKLKSLLKKNLKLFISESRYLNLKKKPERIPLCILSSETSAFPDRG